MIREITINAVANGFIVQVGCQRLVYTSVDKLALDLSAYLRDPRKTEKRILMEECFNKEHTMDGPMPTGCITEAHMAPPLPHHLAGSGVMQAQAEQATNEALQR